MNTPNYFWFFVLSGISLIVFIITIITHKEKKRLVQTYFFISGLAYIVDYFILIIFHGYDYKPNLIKTFWFDSTLGSIVSQGLAIPTAASVIAAFHYPFVMIILTTISFIGIEELFIKFELYDHHWWRTWITFLLLPICFYLAKFWYEKLKNPTRVVRYITMYLTISVYSNTLQFLLIVVFSTHLYSVEWFSDPYRNTLALNALIIFLFMFLITFVVMFQFKWYWIAGVLFFKWLLDDFLVKKELLFLAENWNLFYFSILHLITIVLFRFIYVKWFTNIPKYYNQIYR